MKNYGNIVMKYVSGDKAKNYKPILASSLADYKKAQLADLKRFLKEDFKVSGNRDNYLQYSALVNEQKKEIEALKVELAKKANKRITKKK